MGSRGEKFDVVVIGAGSGGLTAAVGLAKAGKKVLLIEREHMGGECTNSGCIPSKAILHRAKAYHQAKNIAGDSAVSRKYRDQAFKFVRETIDKFLEEESVENFSALGIKVVRGEAKFISKCSLKVRQHTYHYKKAVVATGSSPRKLEDSGINKDDILTNQNLFKLKRLPERLLIIGSGPIGLEMGQAFALLGTKVTIATIDRTLAKHEDPAIADIIASEFNKLNIKMLTSAHLERVENRQAIFKIKAGEKEVGAERVAYDKVLVAIGRVPNLPAGLEEAGIEHTKHGIETDSQYRTSNKHVYAVGDVTERLKFTHTAGDGAREVVAHIISRGWLRTKRKKAVPKVTYLSPEVAQVGLSYREAIEKYGEKEIIRLKVPYERLDRAQTDEATNGLAVVIARRLYGTVLGANIAGARAGEIISNFTVAVEDKKSLWSLRKYIYAYPTYSTLVQKVADEFLASQLKTWKKDVRQQIKKHLPKIIALIFWSILIYNFQHYKAVNDLTYSEMLLSLYEFFTMSMWGPIIYIALYTVRPLIFFPATLLTALSGALFGLWWGIIYTVIGENFSANLAYWIGRFFGNGFRLEDSFFGNWIEWLRSRPFESVLFMRLFYVPFDLANYGSGVLKVSWPSYALATLIGIMPGLTTFVALGAAVDVEGIRMNGLGIDAFDPAYLALSVSIFVVSIVLMRTLKKLRNRNQ